MKTELSSQERRYFAAIHAKAIGERVDILFRIDQGQGLRVYIGGMLFQEDRKTAMMVYVWEIDRLGSAYAFTNGCKRPLMGVTNISWMSRMYIDLDIINSD
jgi:hypothetical protein